MAYPKGLFFVICLFYHHVAGAEIGRMDLLPTDYASLLEDSSGRSAWTGREQSSQCRGTVTRLGRDEATELKSHFSYGKEPYPEDYQCRWLFIPEGCNLGIECSLNTQQQGGDGADKVRRRRRRDDDDDEAGCSAGDYLRVLGYRGTSDTFYCGSRSLNQTFSGDDAVAIVFRSLQKDGEDYKPTDSERQSYILSSGGGGVTEGFNCRIVCRGEEKKVATTTTAAPPTTTTATSSTTASGPNCRCGETREARIVCPPSQASAIATDGRSSNCTAALGSIPWQAAIVHAHRSQPWCGGTLISDQYVLTAGHCMHGKSADRIQIVLGDSDWTSKEESRDQRFGVDEIKVHPKFGREAEYDYDFALVRLDRPVDFLAIAAGGSSVRPACLPSNDDNGDEDALVGRTADVSGWGVTDPNVPRKQARRLQRVSVRVIPNRECRDKYNGIPVTSTMMCASTPDGDACFGDSGGPMTVRENGGGVSVLEGVISWGKSCARQEWPGVYARVRDVLGWIEENTGDSNYCRKREGRQEGKGRSGGVVVNPFDFVFPE